MYRYEVTQTVHDDIVGVVGSGKNPFALINGKYSVDETKVAKKINYYDAPSDSYKSETLDEICQDLYSSDFATNSTKVLVDTTQHVRSSGVTESGGLRARLVGTHFGTATKNSTTDFDWQMVNISWIGQNKQCYFNGVEYYAKDAEVGDKITFQVVDVDGLVYPAGTVLEEFATGWPVMPDTNNDILLYKAKMIPGFYIRIKYESVSTTTDVKLACGIYRHIHEGEDV